MNEWNFCRKILPVPVEYGTKAAGLLMRRRNQWGKWEYRKPTGTEIEAYRAIGETNFFLKWRDRESQKTRQTK